MWYVRVGSSLTEPNAVELRCHATALIIFDRIAFRDLIKTYISFMNIIFRIRTNGHTA